MPSSEVDLNVQICFHSFMPYKDKQKQKEYKDAYNKRWYANPENKAKTIRRNRHNQSSIRGRAQLFVYEYLLTHPCVDCGEADPVVLEFDHIEDNKVHGISDLATTYALANHDRLAAEIAKCEVRCANCHRRVTAARGDFWRHRIKLEKALSVRAR